MQRKRKDFYFQANCSDKGKSDSKANCSSKVNGFCKALSFERTLSFVKAVVATIVVAVAFTFTLFQSFESANIANSLNKSETALALKQTNSTRTEVRVPSVMYHNMLNSRRGTYIVSAAQFESDLSALISSGYETVFPSELIAYVKEGAPLPEKPVLISFDDGHYNNLYYALPILKKYNAKAVVNPVGSYSEYSTTSGDHSNPNYSHLTWSQMKELIDSGRFELGNHSYDMHKFKPRYGVAKMYGESSQLYESRLILDVSKLQNKIVESTGFTPVTFAYPFGKYDEESEKILRALGFELFLTCNEKVSTLKLGDEKSLRAIGRFNRNGAYSTQQLLKKLAE